MPPRRPDPNPYPKVVYGLMLTLGFAVATHDHCQVRRGTKKTTVP